MDDLATVYSDQGSFDKAQSLYAEALGILRDNLGPDHPRTLNALNNLGFSYLAAGSVDKAEALFAQVLAARAAFVGTNLLNLPEQDQKEFERQFAAERELNLTNALSQSATGVSGSLGAETNRLYKGLRLGARQEALTRLHREGGPEAERLAAAFRELSRRIESLQGNKQQTDTAAHLRKERDTVEEKLLRLVPYKGMESTNLGSGRPPGAAGQWSFDRHGLLPAIRYQTGCEKPEWSLAVCSLRLSSGGTARGRSGHC